MPSFLIIRCRGQNHGFLHCSMSSHKITPSIFRVVFPICSPSLSLCARQGKFFSANLFSELHLPQASNPCLNVREANKSLPQIPPSSLPGSSDHPPTTSHGAIAPRAWNTGSLGTWPSSDGHHRTRTTPNRRGCQFLVRLCLSEEPSVARMAFLKWKP